MSLLLLAVSFIVMNPRLRESLFGPRKAITTQQPPDSPKTKPKQVPADSGNGSRSKTASQLSRYELRNDDGKLLWMTPTSGSPIAAAKCGAGAQLVLTARPHELVNSLNGKQVLRALGPRFEAGRQAWETEAGYTFEQIAQLTVCLHTTESSPSTSMVVHLQEVQSSDQLLAAWGNPEPTAYHDQRYYLARGWAFFIPEQESVTQFVMGSEPLIQEVIDTQDRATYPASRVGTLASAIRWRSPRVAVVCT